MEISKEFTLEMAHRLTFHKGKCFNLHGHSYKVIVVLQGKPNKAGILLDYGDVKEVFNKIIFEHYDHSLLVCEWDEFFKNFIGHRYLKVNALPFESTAENLALHFYRLLSGHLEDLVKVTVKETENTSASCHKNFDGERLVH